MSKGENVFMQGWYWCRNAAHRGDRRVKPEDCLRNSIGGVVCPQCKKKVATRPLCLRQKGYLKLKRFDL